MKLFKRTFYQRENELEFSRFGGRFGFWEMLKRGGTGSPRMHYVSGAVSEQIGMGGNGLLPTASLEVRPEALIIHINCYNQNHFSWAVYNKEISRLEWIESPEFEEQEAHHDFSRNAAVRIWNNENSLLCELAVDHIYKKAVKQFLTRWISSGQRFIYLER